MANDIIQAQYEQLDGISQHFGSQADATAALRDQLIQRTDALKNGGWEGKGSAAFFAEMDDKISPAVGRLIEAFQTAQSVTLEAKNIIQEAEELAANPFKNGQTGGTTPTGGQSPIPEVVSAAPGTFDKRRNKYSVGKPIVVKDHPFRSGKADAQRFDVTVDGQTIPVYVPAKAAGSLNIHSQSEIAKALAAMPEANRKLIKSVNMNPGQNPDDAYWAKEYNRPNFRSYMTAGTSGTVNIYPTTNPKGQHILDGDMIHETGHIWSKNNWGTSYSDKRWDDWKAAIKGDGKYISNYAKASEGEDFSETLQYYHQILGTKDEAATRKSMPARFKIIDEIVAGKR